MNDIIISFTSWKKRINNIPIVLSSIMNNTILPSAIELNLSLEEFPNKENDLPKIIFSYPNLNINWCEGNTKSFKKLIPTVQKYFNKKESIVITIDDDVLYEKTFIEKMLNASNEFPEAVISHNCCRGLFHNQQCVSGEASLYKIKFFSDFLWNGLIKEIIDTNEDDWWYSFNFFISGSRQVKYIPINLTYFSDNGGHQYESKNTYKILEYYWQYCIRQASSFDILNNLTLLTCTYNNNFLTNCMIKSAFKQFGREIPIVIMDNGTREFCSDEMKTKFTVIDNTNFKIVPNYGQISKNHSASIDYALKNCIKTKYVILCDNDILFYPTIKHFLHGLSQDFDALGMIGSTDGNKTPSRLFPFFCIFKTEIFKKINYFDENNCMNNYETVFDENGFLKIDKISPSEIVYGDTGASVLNELKLNNFKIIEFDIGKIMIHLTSCSYSKEKSKFVPMIMEKYKYLYD